jgi:DNA-binding NarL/FixJ family response regulator
MLRSIRFSQSSWEEIENRMAQPVTPLPETIEKIRVLAADSTRMSSQLLADALAQERQFDVKGIEAKGSSIIEAVVQHKPHVLLLSSSLEGSTTLGFEIMRQVHTACSETRVILLLDSANPSTVVEAFRSGAQGIFSRTESSKALAKCINSVHQGQVWANSAELRYLLQALREATPMRMVDHRGDAILSKREQEVVGCVAEGLSNREIAARLKLTEHTVKNYLFRIFDKLGVSSRVEVVLYAFNLRKYIGEPTSGAELNVSSPEPGPAKPSKPAGSAAVEVKKSAEPLKELARRARM